MPEIFSMQEGYIGERPRAELGHRPIWNLGLMICQGLKDD
jgi:hypothetical protein